MLKERIKLNLLLNLSNLNSNSLVYLNPALNNPALEFSFPSTRLTKTAFPGRYERRTRTTGTSRYSYRFRLTPGAPGAYLSSFLAKYFIKSKPANKLACEYSRFSLLLAAKDVLPGGTSATQRLKFHTDDVKFVRNLARSFDWST